MGLLMKSLATATILLGASGMCCVVSCDITDDKSKLKLAGGYLLMCAAVTFVAFLVAVIWRS